MIAQMLGVPTADWGRLRSWSVAFGKLTSETWTSPDLKITARQVTDDPRTGKATTELTNIDRSDPAPSLFKAPDGYTVVEMPRL